MPPAVAGVMWIISSGSQYCALADGGACVTSGTPPYSNSESCTVTAAAALYATASNFSTESYWDYVMIGGVSFSGTNGPSNVPMATGDTFSWWRRTVSNRWHGCGA